MSNPAEKKCRTCQNILPIEEFASKAGKVQYAHCLNCRRILSKKRMRERRGYDPSMVREHIINCLGGRCARCGYDEFISALEFHHVNPTEKDGNVSKLIAQFCYGGTASQWIAIEKEIAKCLLLCSNCHQSLHHLAWHDIAKVRNGSRRPVSIPLPGQIDEWETIERARAEKALEEEDQEVYRQRSGGTPTLFDDEEPFEEWRAAQPRNRQGKIIVK